MRMPMNTKLCSRASRNILENTWCMIPSANSCWPVQNGNEAWWIYTPSPMRCADLTDYYCLNGSGRIRIHRGRISCQHATSRFVHCVGVYVLSLRYGRPPYIHICYEVRGRAHMGADPRHTAAVRSLRGAFTHPTGSAHKPMAFAVLGMVEAEGRSTERYTRYR